MPADLQAIIDAGQGDRPLKDLRFRCTKCGSRLTDNVVDVAKDALGVSRGGLKQVANRSDTPAGQPYGA